jgi:glycosyltransferase involved in cell wall biosynthesis
LILISLIRSKVIRDINPVCSIVIPVFNQAMHISEVLNSIIINMELDFELNILDDCSNDETCQVIFNFLNSYSLVNSKLVSYKFYTSSKSLFEVTSEDFLIRKSEGEFIICVQSDMYINEKGFDLKFLNAFSKNDDIFILSGRGTHRFQRVFNDYRNGLGSDRSYSNNLFIHILILLRRTSLMTLDKFVPRNVVKTISSFRQNISIKSSKINNLELQKLQLNSTSDNPMASILPSEIDFKTSGEAGRLGSLISITEGIHSGQKIWLSETVMRGPLFFRKKDYIELGGFDTRSFFQGFDEHDLILRAWLKIKKRAGYLHVGFSSPLEIGTTRKPRTLLNEFTILRRIIRIRGQRKRSMLYQASFHLNTPILVNSEIRDE